MNTIYKITNLITNQIYVGQSTDVNKRFRDYKKRLAPGQHKLYESFVKYGILNHKFEIICNCEDEVTDQLEIYFIKHYNSLYYTNNKGGLNLSRGGRRGSAHPDEIKAKIAKTLTGGKQSQETINKKRAKNSKVVIVLDKDFNLYRKFDSVIEVGEFFKIPAKKISTIATNTAKCRFKKKREYYILREKDYTASIDAVKKHFAQ